MEKKSINIGFTVPPNILHAGIFVALSKGYYREEGILVNFTWPRNEELTGKDYMTETVDDLCNKKYDVIFGSFSTVVSYNINKSRIPLVALSGLTQRDVITIASLRKSGIDTPKKLDGKKVGICGLPFEDGCVRELIKSNGGQGNVHFVYPPFQHIVEGLKEGKYDACHIIEPWQGVWAKKHNMDISTFGPLDRFGVPRHYPVLVSVKDVITEKKSLISTFLKATSRGYRDLVRCEPREIAKILKDTVQHENMKDTDFLEESLKVLRDYFEHSESSKWGFMKEEDWRNFVHFLGEKKLLIDEDGRPINEDHVNIKTLFTNELLGLGSD